MTYMHIHMPDALKHHVLTVVCDTEDVKVYKMHRPGDSAYRVQITFSPEGIAIQGDVGLGPNQGGICTMTGGYGVGWFGREQSEGYLCSKFMVKQWQRRVVTRDLRAYQRDALAELQDATDGGADEEEIEGLKEVSDAWSHLVSFWDEDDTSDKELHEEGSQRIPDFWDYGIGMDYPLADAGWLVAIQQRFAALYAETRERKHYLMVWHHNGFEDYPGCTWGKDEADARGNTTDTDHYEFREINPDECPSCKRAT